MPRRKTAAPSIGQHEVERSVTRTADRPHMPGYGISAAKKGMLPWSWARSRLAANRNFWISTLRPDGRPHAMPVWGVWHNDRLFFSTAITSLKARNLLANPVCTATTESGAEAVIVEGRATVISDPVVLKPVWNAYRAKYNWPMDGEDMFALAPATVFGFIETADQFATAATRWRFGQHSAQVSPGATPL